MRRLTPEEIEIYGQYREKRRDIANAWYAKNRAKKEDDSPAPLTLEAIKRHRKAGLPLTSEENAIYDSWHEKKMEYQKEWLEKNSGYHREYSRKRHQEKKAGGDMPMAAGQ